MVTETAEWENWPISCPPGPSGICSQACTDWGRPPGRGMDALSRHYARKRALDLNFADGFPAATAAERRRD